MVQTGSKALAMAKAHVTDQTHLPRPSYRASSRIPLYHQNLKEIANYLGLNSLDRYFHYLFLCEFIRWLHMTDVCAVI